MRRSHELLSATVLVAMLGCGNSPAAKPKPADDASTAADDTVANPARVRLVVLIVIDQLPSWRFDVDEPALTGGLRRLIDRGTYIPRAEFPFAATYTAPGHAALCTGAPPSETGILANGWYDPVASASIGSTVDVSSPVFWLGSTPRDRASPIGGVSGHLLRVDGIADALNAQTGNKGKSISVGLKERAAVFALGRRPSLAIWYDDDQVALTTSRWYAATAPAWLAQLARTDPLSRYLENVWKPVDPARLAKLAGGPDARPGEGENVGLGTTFPHSLAGNSEAAKAVRATPWGTQIVIDGALAAVDGEQLGKDDVPDLLALTFSSHDYAGHYWGQESWERVELLLDLDQRLGTFLDKLDRRVGADQYAVLVSSDHGAAPLIEASVAAGHRASRIKVDDIMATANAAAASVLGPGTWVDHYAASTLYATAALRSLPIENQHAALDAVVAAVGAMDGIGYAVRSDTVASKCDERAGIEALACRSIQLDRSGQVFLTPTRYSITTTTYFTGTSHGTASDEDRYVPIIVAGPGVPKQRVTKPCSVLQIAPTLARLLGIDPPAAATGTPLW
jgi:predicted AlkP superfamily pyrophosphatase or phosphodiesterase